MLGTKPAYILIVNMDTRLLPYRYISYLPPALLLIHTAPTMRIDINLLASTKMTDSNAITFPVENSLLGAAGVRTELVKQPGQLRNQSLLSPISTYLLLFLTSRRDLHPRVMVVIHTFYAMEKWIGLVRMLSVELLIYPLFPYFKRNKLSILHKIPNPMTELKKLHFLPNHQLLKLILPLMPTKLQFQKQLLFLPLQQLRRKLLLLL